MEGVTFGVWLKRQRRAVGLTQAQLAHRVGCAAITLRKIEAEERRPSEQIAEHLAQIFDIPSNERERFMHFARGNMASALSETTNTIPWYLGGYLNLPVTTTSLLGREQDVAHVRDYLQDEAIRLVTLIGPPGIGKTRLGIESARAAHVGFRDGVFFVALAPLEEPSLIAPTIVRALGFVEAEPQSPIGRLKEGIGNKQMLIVLDNCEHLIEEVALLVSDLLSACSGLKILATSREGLHIHGEWLYTVPPLGTPKGNSAVDVATASTYPSLALFAERARAVRSEFGLNADNVQVVATICERLDGLPLTIELIAARMRWMSPQELLAKLSDQLVLSADGMRGVLARQRTLDNAIAWSYNLLSKEEQLLFAGLSVFSGGFSLDAAERIFPQAWAGKPTSNLVVSLLDKSLLQHAPDEKGESRFNMLVTIQQFARDRLRRMGGESEARNRHLAYFIDLAEQADKEIHGSAQVEWMDCLEKEIGNFRAAFEWCVSEQYIEVALRLLCALNWWGLVRNHESEMRGWFDQIRMLPEIVSHPALYARVLNQLGHHHCQVGHYRAARSVLHEAQAIWLKLGVDGERGLAEALSQLGWVTLLEDGEARTSQSLFERSLDLLRKYSDQWGMAITMLRLGTIEVDRARDASARMLLEQSMTLFEQLGDSWGIARASGFLGELSARQEDYEIARRYFDQHLALVTTLNSKQGIAVGLCHLGNLCREQGNFDQAEQYYQKSLALCRLYSLKTTSSVLYSLGVLALARNNYPLAKEYFGNYFTMARTSVGKMFAYQFFNGISAVAAGMDQAERAARLYGVVQAILGTIDNRIPPIEQAEFDRHISLAREELGDATFETHAAEGRIMTLPQAITYALSE